MMWFSDGNDRVTALVEASQRVHTKPHFRADMGVDFSFSANSRHNVPYFSPEADLATLTHLTLTPTNHCHYETACDNVLTSGAVGYWQHNKGTGTVRSQYFLNTLSDTKY